MKRSILAMTALVSLVALSACQTNDWGTKQTVGTAGGAALGGLLGNQFGGGATNSVLTAAGVLLGGWLGNEVGASLDAADANKIRGAEYRAYSAPVGQQITWANPQTGNSGTITPTREGTSSSGQYCREFQQTVTIGGQKQQGYGTACRQPDGSWQIVK